MFYVRFFCFNQSKYFTVRSVLEAELQGVSKLSLRPRLKRQFKVFYNNLYSSLFTEISTQLFFTLAFLSLLF